MIKLTASLMFWNEVSCLEKCLNSLEFFDEVICTDGRFIDYPGKTDLSDDGSREIVKKFPNVKLIDAIGKTLYEKANNNFKEVGKLNSDFNLILAPDCYLVGDPKKFRKKLEEIKDYDVDLIRIPLIFKNYFQKPSDEIIIPEYAPYLIKNPKGVYVHPKYHGWLMRGNKRIGKKNKLIIDDITMVHDDSCRNTQRQSDGIMYTRKLMEKESKFIKSNYPLFLILQLKKFLRKIKNI